MVTILLQNTVVYLLKYLKNFLQWIIIACIYTTRLKIDELKGIYQMIIHFISYSCRYTCIVGDLKDKWQLKWTDDALFWYHKTSGNFIAILRTILLILVLNIFKFSIYGRDSNTLAKRIKLRICFCIWYFYVSGITQQNCTSHKLKNLFEIFINI